MIAERNRLEEQITSIHSQLKTFPNGNLICTRNDTRYKWYQSDGKKSVYIPKSNLKLARQLAVKKYLSSLLTDLEHEKAAITKYLQHHDTHPPSAESVFTKNPEYQKLIFPYFKPLSLELYDWMTSPYERSTKYPEQLIHKTASGNLVRSKSESLIDMILYTNKIPFRYECPLTLGDTTLYPDFTIRHPYTGKTYYWEHFGLMDDPMYSKNACSKLQLYTSHNIIPTIHLITTYETREYPLDAEKVEHIIKEYFC